MKSEIHRHVITSDEAYELPYSEGLMAASIMATGLSPARPFHVAEAEEADRSHIFQHGVPILRSHNLDATLSQAIELVVAQATDAVPTQPTQRSMDGAAMSPVPKGAIHMPGGER